MDSPILRKLVSALVAILLLVYIGYQVYNANYTQVKTEVATYAVNSDYVQTTGIAVRQETLIQQAVSGVLSYKITSGGKVSKGGVVADIYGDAQDASSQQQIAQIDNEIDRLTRLNTPGDTYAANPDLLNTQIDQKLVELLGGIHNGEYSQLSSDRDDFLYLLNERQIVVGKAENFNDRISSLKSQRDALASSSSQRTGQITAPVSGYFINEADGWEGVFDYSTVLDLSADQVKEKLETSVVPAADVIGKVCGEFNWYFVCVLQPEEALKLSVDDKVSIELPFASTEAIPAQVAAVNQVNRESQAAVVLESSYMNHALASIRRETVQIRVEEYSGILISQRSIHFKTIEKTFTDAEGKKTVVKKDVKGVYVLHGSKLEFVEIIPLFNNGSYVICKALNEMSDQEEIAQLMTDGTLQLYDEVVIEGTDLYDGKVVK